MNRLTKKRNISEPFVTQSAESLARTKRTTNRRPFKRQGRTCARKICRIRERREFGEMRRT